MHPQLYFLSGHSLAQATRNLIRHEPHRAAFGGHPPLRGGIQNLVHSSLPMASSPGTWPTMLNLPPLTFTTYMVCIA